ncbi:MAG: PQQ-binding-like beta-propeller repeat protein [Pirellulales bacterium]|nr:PQQ-binding-like beta-propeller repeat protein [Pirellulales bacterium]
MAVAFVLCGGGCHEAMEPVAAPGAPAHAGDEPTPQASPPAGHSAERPATSQGQWPGWRGPGGRSIAPATKLPAEWPSGKLAPRWSAALGSGWSSPIVADGRVFVTDREGNRERTLAFDTDTGEPLWESSSPVDFEPHDVGQRHGNGPKSTCCHAEGKVYSLGIAGRLKCLEAATGKIVWEKLLPAEFGQKAPLPRGRAYVNGTENVIVPIGDGQGAPVPLFGYTGSPTIAGRLLILEVGGARGGTLMAFDRHTGEVVWKSLEENVSYSSPIVAELAGVPQVIAMTGPRIVGLDLRDGRLLWSHPFQIQYDESISTPVAADDMVFVTADHRPLTALRLERDGDGMRKSVAWENRDLSSYLSSMLAHAGHIYGMNDGGEWAAVRIADGKTAWVDGDHGYYCSPVLAGNVLLGLNEDASIQVIAATPDSYQEQGEFIVAKKATWSAPALVDGRLYIRSEDTLATFDLAP